MAHVDIGLQNHGPIANSPWPFSTSFDVVRQTRSPALHWNFYWFGVPLDELYTLIEKYALRVKHACEEHRHAAELANVRL